MFCNNLLERVATDTNPDLPASQNYLNETNVSNSFGVSENLFADKELDAGLDNQAKIEPIVRLWILRLLIPLECHRKFIRKHDFKRSAELLNMWVGGTKKTLPVFSSRPKKTRSCY